MSENTLKQLPFPKLDSTNYSGWATSMEAYLKSQKVWRIVSEAAKKPTGSDAAALVAIETWEEKRDQAAGILWLGIDESIKTLVKDHRDDPVKMWAELKANGTIKVSSTLFNAYNAVFEYQHTPGEKLISICNDIKTLMRDMYCRKRSLSQM